MEGVTPTVWRDSMDKLEYDRPDDSKGNRALIFLGLAVVVVGIFYFGYYR